MRCEGGAASFVVVVVVLPLLARALPVQRSARTAAADAHAQVDDALVDTFVAYETTTAWPPRRTSW